MPVVHVMDIEQTLHNVQIALWNGADGVFLISHGYAEYGKLIDIYTVVRKRFQNFWIGLNFLDLSTMEAVLRVPANADGLWTDNAWIDEGSTTQAAAEAIWDARKRRTDWKGLYFGGVAFKYQKKSSNATQAARLATSFMDVVTTSGDATSSAPSVDKITAMRKAVGSRPIAIASGIAKENAAQFKTIADYALVWSSIKKNESELDPDAVRGLSKALHH